jgi:predicted Zn-dependent peptidase
MMHRLPLRARLLRAGFLVAAALLAGCASPSPAARSTTVTPAPFDRAVPPTLGGPPSLTLPPVVRRQLPNGLTLLVVEQHELPLADFLLLVGTGAEADPPRKSGLATLAADVLDEGTPTRESLAIADQQAYLGVQLQTASSWDASTVSLHTPTAQLDSALALFADVVLHPTFPEREFTRLRTQRITGLIQLKDRSPAIADRAYANILFGDVHPYGHSLAGTEASVAAISRDDVAQFYRTYFRPNNATLVVVGDVKPSDVERRVAALFGGWERAEVPVTRYAATQPPATTTVYLIDKPGAPQSSIRIGTIGVPRSTEDYFAIQVMNTVLGGAFTSRLNQNLRETHGICARRTATRTARDRGSACGGRPVPSPRAPR